MENKQSFVLAAMFLVVVSFGGWAHAQSNSLPLGQVKLPVVRVSCPLGFNEGTACYSSTLSCPDTLDIGFTYGVVNPGGKDGTIVLFNGGDGTVVGFAQEVAEYTPPAHDFQTVQVMWSTAWEATEDGTGTSLKAAACRPATLTDWLLNQKNVYAGGGMCAQGSSAGSAAVAYSLAEYGASRYLDHVDLESGPVMSDISVGCNPQSPEMTVCPGDSCLTGGKGGWSDSPLYVGGDQNIISTWSGASGANACLAGNRIPQQQYDAWKQMSIVDGLTGRDADSTFAYPQTSVTGWLCGKPPGCNSALCQNNSAAEGQLFYENVTTPISVYRVDNCEGSEGVEQGTVPQLNDEAGIDAIIADMVDNCGSKHRFAKH